MKTIIANMKMNQTPQDTKKYLIDLISKNKEAKNEIVVCPPATSLFVANKLLYDTNIGLGAQDMSWEKSGAFTGEISPEMLKAVGVTNVILGHSERRKLFGETNKNINLKIKTALQYRIRAIFCCGESLPERESGKTDAILKQQIEQGLSGLYENELKSILIAYEPVWAIGTGETAGDKQIEQAAETIRSIIAQQFSLEASKKIKVLYGGSVSKSNARKIVSLKGIDGLLVGSKSLDAEEFTHIIEA